MIKSKAKVRRIFAQFYVVTARAVLLKLITLLHAHHISPLKAQQKTVKIIHVKGGGAAAFFSSIALINKHSEMKRERQCEHETTNKFN